MGSVPERVNLEVSGSPECLALAVHAMDEIDVSFATAPVFSNAVGQMQFGPVEGEQLQAANLKLQELSCVRAIRQRPCATPTTDVNWCDAPKPSR